MATVDTKRKIGRIVLQEHFLNSFQHLFHVLILLKKTGLGGFFYGSTLQMMSNSHR
jgi:hypothetical protein